MSAVVALFQTAVGLAVLVFAVFVFILVLVIFVDGTTMDLLWQLVRHEWDLGAAAWRSAWG